mmetsp:Transcript_4225/g.15930  ORF Transcript_4225/g.15930 Transcript_4225/m.15930 type:complete len:1850 (-) Transcript_4225:2344-7893(-)
MVFGVAADEREKRFSWSLPPKEKKSISHHTLIFQHNLSLSILFPSQQHPTQMEEWFSCVGSILDSTRQNLAQQQGGQPATAMGSYTRSNDPTPQDFIMNTTTMPASHQQQFYSSAVPTRQTSPSQASSSLPISATFIPHSSTQPFLLSTQAAGVNPYGAFNPMRPNSAHGDVVGRRPNSPLMRKTRGPSRLPRQHYQHARHRDDVNERRRPAGISTRSGKHQRRDHSTSGASSDSDSDSRRAQRRAKKRRRQKKRDIGADMGKDTTLDERELRKSDLLDEDDAPLIKKSANKSTANSTTTRAKRSTRRLKNTNSEESDDTTRERRRRRYESPSSDVGEDSSTDLQRSRTRSGASRHNRQDKRHKRRHNRTYSDSDVSELYVNDRLGDSYDDHNDPYMERTFGRPGSPSLARTARIDPFEAMRASSPTIGVTSTNGGTYYFQQAPPNVSRSNTSLGFTTGSTSSNLSGTIGPNNATASSNSDQLTQHQFRAQLTNLQQKLASLENKLNFEFDTRTSYLQEHSSKMKQQSQLELDMWRQQQKKSFVDMNEEFDRQIERCRYEWNEKMTTLMATVKDHSDKERHTYEEWRDDFRDIKTQISTMRRSHEQTKLQMSNLQELNDQKLTSHRDAMRQELSSLNAQVSTIQKELTDKMQNLQDNTSDFVKKRWDHINDHIHQVIKDNMNQLTKKMHLSQESVVDEARSTVHKYMSEYSVQVKQDMHAETKSQIDASHHALEMRLKAMEQALLKQENNVTTQDLELLRKHIDTKSQKFDESLKYYTAQHENDMKETTNNLTLRFTDFEKRLRQQMENRVEEAQRQNAALMRTVEQTHTIVREKVSDFEKETRDQKDQWEQIAQIGILSQSMDALSSQVQDTNATRESVKLLQDKVKQFGDDHDVLVSLQSQLSDLSGVENRLSKQFTALQQDVIQRMSAAADNSFNSVDTSKIVTNAGLEQLRQQNALFETQIKSIRIQHEKFQSQVHNHHSSTEEHLLSLETKLANINVQVVAGGANNAPPLTKQIQKHIERSFKKENNVLIDRLEQLEQRQHDLEEQNRIMEEEVARWRALGKEVGEIRKREEVSAENAPREPSLESTTPSPSPFSRPAELNEPSVESAQLQSAPHSEEQHSPQRRLSPAHLQLDIDSQDETDALLREMEAILSPSEGNQQQSTFTEPTATTDEDGIPHKDVAASQDKRIDRYDVSESLNDDSSSAASYQDTEEVLRSAEQIMNEYATPATDEDEWNEDRDSVHTEEPILSHGSERDEAMDAQNEQGSLMDDDSIGRLIAQSESLLKDYEEKEEEDFSEDTSQVDFNDEDGVETEQGTGNPEQETSKKESTPTHDHVVHEEDVPIMASDPVPAESHNETSDEENYVEDDNFALKTPKSTQEELAREETHEEELLAYNLEGDHTANDTNNAAGADEEEELYSISNGASPRNDDDSSSINSDMFYKNGRGASDEIVHSEEADESSEAGYVSGEESLQEANTSSKEEIAVRDEESKGPSPNDEMDELERELNAALIGTTGDEGAEEEEPQLASSVDAEKVNTLPDTVDSPNAENIEQPAKRPDASQQSIDHLADDGIVRPAATASGQNEAQSDVSENVHQKDDDDEDNIVDYDENESVEEYDIVDDDEQNLRSYDTYSVVNESEASAYNDDEDEYELIDETAPRAHSEADMEEEASADEYDVVTDNDDKFEESFSEQKSSHSVEERAVSPVSPGEAQAAVQHESANQFDDNQQSPSKEDSDSHYADTQTSTNKSNKKRDSEVSIGEELDFSDLEQMLQEDPDEDINAIVNSALEMDEGDDIDADLVFGESSNNYVSELIGKEFDDLDYLGTLDNQGAQDGEEEDEFDF